MCACVREYFYFKSTRAELVFPAGQCSAAQRNVMFGQYSVIGDEINTIIVNCVR